MQTLKPTLDHVLGGRRYQSATNQKNTPKRPSGKSPNLLIYLVSPAGFEPATPGVNQFHQWTVRLMLRTGNRTSIAANVKRGIVVRYRAFFEYAEHTDRTDTNRAFLGMIAIAGGGHSHYLIPSWLRAQHD